MYPLNFFLKDMTWDVRVLDLLETQWIQGTLFTEPDYFLSYV